MISVELPPALTGYAGGNNIVELTEKCSTVREALAALGRQSPGVMDRVMDETGQLRANVNVFVDAENIRFANGLESPVGDGSAIYILSAISGG